MGLTGLNSSMHIDVVNLFLTLSFSNIVTVTHVDFTSGMLVFCVILPKKECYLYSQQISHGTIVNG